MKNNSKLISKSDDSSKIFIIDSLKSNETHGMDVDSFYFVDSTWYLFEFLKCDSDYVNPHTSDPKRYPWNWKKFHTLFYLASQLGGKLILINYSDKERNKHMVRMMVVEKFNYEILRDYINNPSKYYRKPVEYMIYSYDKQMTKDEFSEWLINFNNKASLPGL